MFSRNEYKTIMLHTIGTQQYCSYYMIVFVPCSRLKPTKTFSLSPNRAACPVTQSLKLAGMAKLPLTCPSLRLQGVDVSFSHHGRQRFRTSGQRSLLRQFAVSNIPTILSFTPLLVLQTNASEVSPEAMASFPQVGMD